MNYKFLFTIILFALSFENIFSASLDQLVHEKVCLRKLDLLAQDAYIASMTWFSNDQSSYQLIKNVEAVSQEQKKMVEAYETYLKEELNKIESKEKNQATNYSQGLPSNLLNQETGLAFLENRLSISLYSLEKIIANLQASSKKIEDDCKDVKDIKNNLDELITGFERWQNFINSSRTLNSLSLAKRKNVGSLIVEYLEIKSQQKQNAKNINGLTKLEGEISFIFKLDEFMDYSETWWRNATILGFGRGLHHQYCQYEEPIRIMRKDIFKGKVLLKRLEKIIEGNDSKLGPKIATEMQSRIAMIEKYMNQLKATGFVGQWQCQVESVTARIERKEIRELLTERCLERLDQYKLKYTSQPKDILEFRVMESDYKDSMIECSKGKETK